MTIYVNSLAILRSDESDIRMCTVLIRAYIIQNEGRQTGHQTFRCLNGRVELRTTNKNDHIICEMDLTV